MIKGVCVMLLCLGMAACGSQVAGRHYVEDWIPPYFVMRDCEREVVKYLNGNKILDGDEFDNHYRVSMWARVAKDGQRVISFTAYDTRSMSFDDAERYLWEEDGTGLPDYPGAFSVGGFGGFPVIIKATILPIQGGAKILKLSDNRI